jgi:hypothetical protein
VLQRLRSRLTYANVTATLAMFLALTGGIAWALEVNSVSSKHIVNDQVKSVDLNENAQAQWALVRDDGSIIEQSGGISVDGENQGSYVLDFGRGVAQRALIATPTYEGSPDIATAHVSSCGNDSDVLKAGCDSLAAGSDGSGRHVLVFMQTTSGSGGNPAAFYVAALPR